jgi:hypothetical protein
MILLPDVIDLTEDQLDALVQIQKDCITQMVDVDIMSDVEALLESQFLEAETEEEQAAVVARVEKVLKDNQKAQEESLRNVSAKMRTKLDTLLTAEQKAKLARIKADVPDYLRNALAGMKGEKSAADATGQNEAGGQASVAWRPGANSWMPGMGAPKESPNRETPRVREQRGERRFPGGE